MKTIQWNAALSKSIAVAGVVCVLLALTKFIDPNTTGMRFRWSIKDWLEVSFELNRSASHEPATRQPDK